MNQSACHNSVEASKMTINSDVLHDLKRFHVLLMTNKETVTKEWLGLVFGYVTDMTVNFEFVTGIPTPKDENSTFYFWRHISKILFEIAPNQIVACDIYEALIKEIEYVIEHVNVE